MPEQFKLTDEMIQQIEDKVNNILDTDLGGMKEELIKAGCYTPCTSVTVCEIEITLENKNVIVTDPTPIYDEDEEEDML